jgi:hypothetical protein
MLVLNVESRYIEEARTKQNTWGEGYFQYVQRIKERIENGTETENFQQCEAKT